MRQPLTLNGEIDILTPAELDRSIRMLLNDRYLPNIIIVRQVYATNANGQPGIKGAQGASETLFEVPAGMVARLRRLVFGSQEANPGNPLTVGWLGIGVNGQTGVPTVFSPDSPSTWTVPNRFEWGGDDAPYFVGGTRLDVMGSGLPTGHEFEISAQVELQRIPQRPARSNG